MNRSRLSDKQLEEVAVLREKGWGLERISDHVAGQGVKISGSAIGWQCLRMGADVPARLRGPSYQPTKSYVRNGHVVRPYTAEEDATILRLSAAGLQLGEITRALGGARKHNSVLGRMMTLARREARAEEAACS